MSIASVLRPALLLVALASAALFSPTVSGQTITSTVADGFNPNVNGNVYAVALQSNGRVLIAGKFETLQPNGQTQTVSRNNIARLLADGRNDDTFNADVNGQIQAMLIQRDGKIVIGGKFTAVNGVTRRRLARLNADGSLDAAFDPNIEPRDFNANPDASLTPEVMALALQSDGKIVVGGGFKFVHPAGGTEVARNRIARFNANGSLDATFDPNASGMVVALAIQADGKILVGGGFKKLQPNGATSALEIKHLARVQANGAADETFKPQPDNSVTAIELLPDGNILIGGSFLNVAPNNGDSKSATHIAQLASDGTVNASFASSVGGSVSVLKRQADGGILVGGAFSTLGGSSGAYFGRLGPTGARDQTFYPSPNFAVYAVAVQDDGSVILGGGFTTMSSSGTTTVVRNHVARVSATGALDNDFRPDVNGRLYSLTGLKGGKLLVGGSFTSIAGSTRQGVVRLNADGSLDTTFRADVAGTVSTAIEMSDGKLLIGGSFSRINGVRRLNLARLHANGTVDEDFDPAPDAAVYAMLLQSDGKLLVGGAFTSLSPFRISSPVSRRYLARINADGTLDLTYKPETGAAVYVLAAQSDGKILVGGAFTAILGNGATSFHYRNAIARLNTDGTVDTGFNPNVNGTIYSLAVQPLDGKIVLAGAFVQLRPNPPTDGTAGADPVTRNNIVRVNADGTLDEAFNPNINGPVTKVLLQEDAKIVVSGNFTALNPNNAGSGVMRNFVARLKPDGTLDESFNLYLDTLIGNIVVGVAQVEDKKLVIAGTFAQLGSPAVARARLARVNSDGSVDASFDSGVSTMGGATIEALTLQYGGDVLAAGDFATLNGATGSSMARFYADSSPDTTFVPSLNGPVHALVETPLKGTSVSTQHAGFAWLQPNGQLQSGFKLDSTITSLTTITRVVVRSDGKIFIAGSLTLPDRTGDGKAETASLALFNPDGSLVPDSEFRLLTTGAIYAIVPLADGKTLIGGSFTTVDGASRTNFARLNADGSLDTSFTASVNGTVAVIKLQSDGKILLAGEFTTVTPSGGSATTRNAFARLNADGTLDDGFNPNPNNVVQAVIVQSDGKILIGGAFTQFSKVVNNVTETTARSYFARLNADGSLDTSIDIKANGTIRAMVETNGKVILGGYFTSLYDTTRNYLGALDAATLALDTTFNPNPNASVGAIGVQPDGKILVGGLFTALEPGGSVYDATRATPRNRIARLEVNGTLDGTFNPNLNSEVGTITVHPNGTSLVTGSFTTVQPFGSMMVGGQFTSVNGISASNLALFASDGSVSSAFLPNPNGAVQALLTDLDGSTVVGGAFTKIANEDRNRIARFTGENALDPSFNPNANGTVYTIVRQPDGKLLVGGEFTMIGGVARERIARLNADGSVDASFSATVGLVSVNSIVLQRDGRILVLGSGSGVRSRLLRLQANGSGDTSFATVTSVSDPIYSIALQTDGRIVLGGGFTSIVNQSRPYLARLNADGSYDSTLTSTPDGAVTAVTIQPDGKILFGGRFTKVDGLPRFGLARVATATTGTAGNAFLSSDSGRTITWVRRGVGPEVASVYFESSDDLADWVQIGNATRVPGTSNWQLANVSLASGHVYVRASGIAPTSPNSSSGLIEAQGLLTTVTLPTITSATVVGSPSGTSFYYATLATGEGLTYSASGLPAGLTIDPATGVITGTPTQVGTYNVVLGATNASGTTTMNLTLIVGAPAGPKVNGTAVEAGTNIRHPNGNTYDQYLLTGTSADLRADPGEVVRVSFIDLDNDIVQVEFTGAGRFSVTLSGSSGPAAPTLYNQAAVNYMKGHATIAITGADETTHMTIFSVGTKTAVNQSLFRSGVTYDGVADIASVSIASPSGRFGSLRCANVAFFSDTGLTGVSAPGVQFASVVYVGDITAFGSATPTLAIGSAAAQTSIHGGDLDQDNKAAVTVSGLTQLKFVAGETSHGGPLAAQANKAVLKQNGVDVTAQIVVNPAP